MTAYLSGLKRGKRIVNYFVDNYLVDVDGAERKPKGFSGRNAKGYVFFECKLHALTQADRNEEQAQVTALPPYAIHPYALGFFGLSKGTLKDEDNPFVYDAADLYR